MLLLEQKWWKEAEDGVLGAIEEHALGESLFHDGAGGDVELQAYNQSAAADFAGDGVAFGQGFQLLLQIRANADDILQQSVFFEDGEIL